MMFIDYQFSPVARSTSLIRALGCCSSSVGAFRVRGAIVGPVVPHAFSMLMVRQGSVGAAADASRKSAAQAHRFVARSSARAQ